MKISIITVTLNSAKTLRDTLNSVHSQNYNNIEHIIVDGGSGDETLKILKQYSFKNKKIFIKKNYGIYKSINYGIKHAKGEIIHILNSDDIYNSNSIIKKMMLNIHKQKKIDLFIGNLIFFKERKINSSTRYIESKKFKKKDLKFGIMPAHPALFVRNRLYKKYGTYNEDFKIASDFDFF
jgi:glycosyltransferase involved in cell wall biosynthesis